MPDLAVPYVLSTPGGDVTFNSGLSDQFYIQEIQGLVMPPIRAPIDDAPFTDGSIGHNFWKGGRHVILDGLFYITSVGPCEAQMEIRNQMEDELRVVLESISGLTTDTGTLTWTARGLVQRTIEIRCDVPLECPEDETFMVRHFHFGLFASDPTFGEA